jgi:catechol 2,3-dioxygenase-like lactoylglutathione lyase family enzyme
MSATDVHGVAGDSAVGRVDLKLEVQIIPVSDVDRAKEFYERVGFRIDSDDSPLEGLRIVQTTPPGSATSVTFGQGITNAAPGSSEAGLIVSDVEAAHHELASRGIEVSDIWHGPPFPVEARQPGVDPERGSYMSFCYFTDPDGNTWLVQEVTARAPGRIDPGQTGYASTSDLASALRRAESAYAEKHPEHHGGLLHRHPHADEDEGRADWYASYMVAEQTGTDPPA